MEIVADASTFLAVVLNEADQDWIIRQTRGKHIVSPEILPYEMGNALIAMRKKGRLNDPEVLRAFNLSRQIVVRWVPVRIQEAIKMALRFHVYAYDAYYLQCCMKNRLPLISLDDGMCRVATQLGIKVVE